MLAATIVSCNRDDDETPDPALKPGGATTVEVDFVNSFQQPAANLNAAETVEHFAADGAFGAIFVTAPAVNFGGLGPIFNQNSCETCHGLNGRAGFPANPEIDPGGLLLRLSLPGSGSHGEPLGVPGFGGQFQNKAIFGVQSEGQVSVSFENEIRTFLDGTKQELRRPIFSIKNPYSTLPAGVMISPRIGPPVIGLGLLEAVPEAVILEKEDPADNNGDGISGKANRVYSVENQQVMLGRFGWKAGQPTLLQQTAAAYLDDMGLTSFLFPKENSEGQPQADPAADDPEIDDETLRLTTFYTQSLAVPAPRNFTQKEVVAGRKLFQKIGCENCHRATMTTGASPFPFLENQQIFAYTDLLLHDMGPGLADNRPEFLADGQEWRTPPLWGIGLTKTVNGHTNFLHDGRARSLLEAVLWHGGEAEKSRQNFEKLTATERESVIRFLEAL